MNAASESEPSSPLLVAYQGEPGAYSEIAARQVGRPAPYRSFVEAFHAVAEGDVAFAAIPLENSLGGTIHENYDHVLQFPVRIVAETYVRVEHCLLGLPGATLEKAKFVLSHPQALAQCDEFLAARPNLEIVASYDTAGSAKIVRESGSALHLAIASEAAAVHYGLDVLARNIASRENNITRFAVIQSARPNVGNADGLSRLLAPLADRPRKTTLAFTLPHKTGSLFHALAAFALRNVGLTKIESRPYREHAFEYLFYVDFIEPEELGLSVRALDHLREVTQFVRVLGTYPCLSAP
jgi:prephenate dehydratase